MDRRTFLNQSAIAGLALATAPISAFASTPKGMGIAAASYAFRWYGKASSKQHPPFSHALHLLDHCNKIGAAGIQTSIRNWTKEDAFKVREKKEALELYVEGQTSLPKEDKDLPAFEASLKIAKEVGIEIIRTVCLSGRRYENFETLEAFQAFRKQSMKSLEMAVPIMKKHKMKLAVENHKDWRIADMLQLMKHFESEWIGVTLDTGNNLSLLEDLMEVVEALAPYTQSIHFKDMSFKEYEEGFLLSEVPLGQGVLDMKKVRAICEKHNPKVNFNLEMITRDPLKVPCLTDKYWATFEQLPGQDLAKTLQKVRRHNEQGGLPQVKGMNPEERLAYEEENIVKSFRYAKEHLGFA